ncbi:MAG: YHS domain-containing (seleno)protein [Pseudomonadota bacterium]
MRSILFTLVVLTFVAAPEPVMAQHAVADAQLNCSPDGVAVGGYDLVSYRQPDGPKIGDPSLAVERDGLRYFFISERNRQRFQDAPDDFLPRYQGWCAATLSMGRLACPDYTNFKIEDGELLLFELTGFTNGRTLWNSDPFNFRRRADDNALKLIRK